MNRTRMNRYAIAAAVAVMAMVGLSACKSTQSTSSAPQPATSIAPTTASPTPTPQPTSTAPSSAAATATATGSGAPAPSAAPPSPSASPSPATPPTVPTLTRKLRVGDHGADVLAVQQQLTALGYWLGKPDGHFGSVTQQAVWALQKVAGLSRSGVVNAATEAALVKGDRPTAKSKKGHVIEVDLKRDVLKFVTDGHVDYILNTSTGGGYTYYDQGQKNVAITPKGHFKTYRVINAPHRSTLGLLIRPRYFVGGDAIHGDGSVPPYPASHGCVRVSDSAINWIWSQKLDPIGTPVWIY
ncbi:MAG TPA: L,D-transpeptidase family protein [Micromonosporaceae bacterium]